MSEKEIEEVRIEYLRQVPFPRKAKAKIREKKNRSPNKEA